MLKENIPSSTDAAKEIRVFRREAVEAVQRNSWLGHLELSTPLPYWLYTVVSVLIVLALIFLLTGFSYTKRISVHGRLISNQGLAYVQSPQPGYIGKIYVQPGMRVSKGDVLALVERRDNILEDERGGDTLLESYNAQILAVREGLKNELATIQQEIYVLQSSIKSHSARIKSLEYEGVVSRKVVESLVEVLAAYRELKKAQAVSGLEIQARKQALADAKLRLSKTDRLIEEKRLLVSVLSQDVLKKNAKITSLELDCDYKIADLSRKKNEYVLKTKNNLVSSVDGTITFVSAHSGEFVSVSNKIFGILPDDIDLVAELDLKTTEAGLIVEGQQVNLKYDAYPYQRYGVFKAAISSVDGASYRADSAQQPIFISRANLLASRTELQGQHINLLPGSTFVAEISVETRKLYQWLILPLQNSVKSI